MKMIITLIAVFAVNILCAQENESSVYQQQLEQLASQDENEMEDDAYLQYLNKGAGIA